MKEHDSIDFVKKDDTATKQPKNLKLSEDSIEDEINRVSEDSEKEYENEDEDVEWDGSESEFVEDDASEYEEQYTGIKFSYTLKKEEIFSCIKYCGINKNVTIVGDFLLGAFVLVYLILYISNNNFINLVCFLTGIVLFPLWVSNILPSLFERMNKDKFPSNKKLSVEVYPDCITIEDGSYKWEILLDGTSKFQDFNNMFLVFVPEHKVFIIPKRAIEPDFLPDIEAMLVAGTEPYQ